MRFSIIFYDYDYGRAAAEARQVRQRGAHGALAAEQGERSANERNENTRARARAIYIVQLQGVHEERARIVNVVFVYKMYTHTAYMLLGIYSQKSDGNRPN